MKHTRFVFAAVLHEYLVPWATRATARDVRHKMGETYAKNGEKWELGWQRAKKIGWRVQKVTVTYIYSAVDRK